MDNALQFSLVALMIIGYTCRIVLSQPQQALFVTLDIHITAGEYMKVNKADSKRSRCIIVFGLLLFMSLTQILGISAQKKTALAQNQ